VCVCVCVCICACARVRVHVRVCLFGGGFVVKIPLSVECVVVISRRLKIVGLFCRISFLL